LPIKIFRNQTYDNLPYMGPVEEEKHNSWVGQPIPMIRIHKSKPLPLNTNMEESSMQQDVLKRSNFKAQFMTTKSRKRLGSEILSGTASPWRIQRRKIIHSTAVTP
jgi:hypothetical protein